MLKKVLFERFIKKDEIKENRNKKIIFDQIRLEELWEMVVLVDIDRKLTYLRIFVFSVDLNAS